MTIMTASIDIARTIGDRRSPCPYVGSRGRLYTIRHGISMAIRPHPWSAVDASNSKEFARFEARAANQGAAHILGRQELLGVRRPHRAAIENAHGAPGGGES